MASARAHVTQAWTLAGMKMEPCQACSCAAGHLLLPAVRVGPCRRRAPCHKLQHGCRGWPSSPTAVSNAEIQMIGWYPHR